MLETAYCDTTILVAAQVSGAENYTLEWGVPNGVFEVLNDHEINISFPTTGVYEITASINYNNEIFSVTENVTICERPSLEITVSDTFICPFDPFTLTAIGTAEEFAWLNGTDLIGTGTSITVDDLESTANITLVGTNCSICETEDFITIEVAPIVELNITSQEACISDDVFDLTANLSGGTWEGTGIVDTENGSFDPFIAEIGNHDITYYYTDPTTACVYEVQTTVIVHNLPTATASYEDTLCVNVPTIIEATPNTINEWHVNGDLFEEANPFVYMPTSTDPVNILLISINANDCRDSIEFTLPVIEPAQAGFTLSSTNVCSGDTVSITNTATGVIQELYWIVDEMTINTFELEDQIFLTSEEVDTIIIEQIIENKCDVISHIDTIFVSPLPEADLGIDDISIICNGDTTLLYNLTRGNADNVEVSCNYCTFVNPDNQKFRSKRYCCCPFLHRYS